jgi:6-pyruvoyltetrahydropterin/6-carboxytetrahydropterin synthase
MMHGNKNFKFELSQSFYFEAAHTLKRSIETEGSARIHGHTYEVEITICGNPNPENGMLTDLGLIRNEINLLRQRLDHTFLDEIQELGPATLENLCKFIAENLMKSLPALTKVEIYRRASGDRCTLRVN